MTCEHEAIPTWPATVLRWRSTASFQAHNIDVLAFDRFDVQHPNLPLPHIQRVADVAEFLLATQRKVAQPFAMSLATEAVDLLSADAHDETQVLRPAVVTTTYYLMAVFCPSPPYGPILGPTLPTVRA